MMITLPLLINCMKIRHSLIFLSVLFSSLLTAAPTGKVYFQWGWNREAYSRSTIHFTNGQEYDFYWEDVKANDKPDFQAIPTLEVTIPQFSFRLGIRVAPQWYIELNHDHAKYVVNPGQQIRMHGRINGQPVDTTSVLDNSEFHFEHTNGANFWMVMAARKWDDIFKNKNTSVLVKAGAGLVYPKTDVTLFGNRLNNEFHVAGYIAGFESSIRYAIYHGLYLDLSGKVGYANYINALTVDGGKASHSFYFAEGIFSIGYQF
jgi:hypothetical protein